MDANKFIAKLKANNTAKDITNLEKVQHEYNVMLRELPQKERALFSLNVLCVLCRNLDKAPTWRESIDNKALLILSIDCVRETRVMERADRVKTLACIYHIHRHAVRQNSPTPPELILKISCMPFEVEAKHLLKEYAKTYWNILVDRLSYIEQKRNNIPIIKLLPKLTEDVIKIIEIYDTVEFSNNIIVILVKKLRLLYSVKDSKELNQIFRKIFTKLSMKDMEVFKKLTENEVMEVYVKLNECLYVIAENSSKTGFKDSPLDDIVRSCILIVAHSPGVYHCLQTFYSNTFCHLLTVNTHLSYSERVLNMLLISIEETDKLGYGKAMLATYPYLNQFLRLYVEFNVTNSVKKPWKDHFNTQIQQSCLKLIQILMRRLKNCDQLLKCDSCQVRSGLHDSLRLSFLVKHFIMVPVAQKLLLSETVPLILDIISNQYKILTYLKELGCVNYEKCFRKLQTDIHNTAISLNNALYYEFSIKLFDIYLKYEINTKTEQRNVSRALYNKSICELDSKFYENAVIDAFLSLVFANDGLSSEKYGRSSEKSRLSSEKSGLSSEKCGPSSEKYMSLVIDIKAKEMKSKDDDDKNETLQLFSVLDACEKALETKMYGYMQPFFMDLKFSALLRHEFAMYARLWPSVTPIGGVWRSLLRLAQAKSVFAEDEDAMWSLYEVVVQTPTVVRNISIDHLNTIITELLSNFDIETLTPDLRIVYASLLFLKTEFELAAAAQKYGWKLTEPVHTSDPDQIPANRTIPQEYNASRLAVQAVAILTELSPNFDSVSNRKCLQNSLHIYQVYVQLLLHLSRDLEGLQLAHICCLIARCVGDNEAFVLNAGTLLQRGAHGHLDSILAEGASVCTGPDVTSITFLCDASMFLSRRGSLGIAARLAHKAQAQVLAAAENYPQLNLDLAVGRLLEALAALCPDSSAVSALSAVNNIQRHYLAAANTGTNWHVRRLRSLTLRVHSSAASARAVRAARSLRLWRRARAAACPLLCSAGAASKAAVYASITDTSCFDDAQIKIDNRLKHILGLQPSNETQPYYLAAETRKHKQFTPKQEIETMLENMMFKKTQTSPSVPCTSVPAFKVPDWFDHDEKCSCYACCIPVCYILACLTSGLEASMYFRANESDIARNYFNGVVKMLNLTEQKLKLVKKKFDYEEFVLDSVLRSYWDWFWEVKIEILIELSFFELKNGAFDVANEHIVEIHEILQETSVNSYISNDIMNLMTCSVQLRMIKKNPEESLEAEFEALKLTPLKFTEPPKTPITKPHKPPQIAKKVIVKDEELPKKRKVIKLNLEEESEREVRVTRNSQFKFPMPATSKPVLESATPITKATPSVIITKPPLDCTPYKTVFFTPKDHSPEQFFTPGTSIKTYTKKSLRQNIVKNLEQEFSTPADKENKTLQVPKKIVKKTLKRATSPGKLGKELRVRRGI